MTQNTWQNTWVVVYDIGDDRRRARAAKVLQSFGVRVQESVFECRLDERQLERLKERVGREIKSGDLLRIYRVCELCLRASWDFGSGPFAESRAWDIIV